MRMLHFAKMGNRVMVKKTYETCREHIEKEMNCPLADETNRLFNALMF